MSDSETDPVVLLEAAPWAVAATIGTLRDVATTATPIRDVLAAHPQRTAVLEAAGLVWGSGADLGVHPMLDIADPATARSAMAARLSALKQAAAAAEGEQAVGGEPAWARQDDEVLLNQGRASAASGRALATRVVPVLPGLAEALAGGKGRVLDVGTGVAALALALAAELPAAEVVGIDVLQRALDLARGELALAEPDVAARVSLRLEDVGAIAEHEAYDLVWLPVPFLPDAAFQAAVPRLRAALRPGGWLVAGTNPAVADPLRQAVAAWTASLNGGNSSHTDGVAEMLRAAGFTDEQRFPTVPGGPVLLAVRRGD
jgi:SAM-dependent methyltransferase